MVMTTKREAHHQSWPQPGRGRHRTGLAAHAAPPSLEDPHHLPIQRCTSVTRSIQDMKTSRACVEVGAVLFRIWGLKSSSVCRSMYSAPDLAAGRVTSPPYFCDTRCRMKSSAPVTLPKNHLISARFRHNPSYKATGTMQSTSMAT